MSNLSSVTLIGLMKNITICLSSFLSLTHSVQSSSSFILCNQFKLTLLTSAAPLFLSDKLFGKHLLQARHYIMSRKSWLKMVPTENCDILMTFPGAVKLQPVLPVRHCRENSASSSLSVFGGQPATQMRD